MVAFVAATVTILLGSGTGSARSDGAHVIRLKGNGPKELPAFRVAAPSTMFWTNSGSFFQISSQGGYCNDGAVSSEARRGTTYIPPGRYQSLRVAAIGAWTITIRTGVEHVGNPITFIGSGGRALPPFRLRSGKTMHWTNTGSLFQSFPGDPSGQGVVSSQRHRGAIHLSAGRHRLFVDASAPEEPAGSWTIVIR